MEAVRYKEFYIVVTVRRALFPKKMFHVVSQIYRNLEEAPVMRNWLPVQEFASKEAAYEYGLQEGRRWIDESE
jgi:hypothetical protein